MTIGTTAALGGVLAAIGSGLAPGLTAADVGVGPMPGPSPEPGVNLGGASLWIVDGKGDEKAAAAWDYITYLITAEAQSQWASQTGYVPVRTDALDLEPLLEHLRRGSPVPGGLRPDGRRGRRRHVARPGARPAARGAGAQPPMRRRRSSTAPTSRQRSPTPPRQANALIASYNQRN